MKALFLKKYPDESFPHNMDFFDIREIPIPTQLGPNEVLIKTIYVSIDPVMRVWLSGAKTYIDAIKEESNMIAFGIGYIVDSRSNRFKKNDTVFGPMDVADYCIREHTKVFRPPPAFVKDDPILPLIFSVYGVTGLTALNSMKQVPESNRPNIKPKTYVVSSAAGSTGSYAIQIAKHMGYRTIGIVSSDDKRDFILSLGADDCVTYNQSKDSQGQIDTDLLTSLIAKAAPEGVDVYFDNAGEEVLDAMLPCMAQDAFIILCGATATYNSWKSRGGLKNLERLITKRIKAEGVLFYGDKEKFYSAFIEMVELVNEGHVKHIEEYLIGVESFVEGLQRVFLGKNLGKVIIKIDQFTELPKF